MTHNSNQMTYMPETIEGSIPKSHQNTGLGLTAVILAGGRDCGRCQLASETPPAMWPILGRTAVERLLDGLALQGINRAVLCCNGHEARFRRHLSGRSPISLSFAREVLPSGTAGCVRDAATLSPDDAFVILPAQSFVLPDISEVMRYHAGNNSALTVVFSRNNGSVSGAHVYVCDRATVGYISPCGYFDIKESLIPALLRANKKVTAVSLAWPAIPFRNYREYLRAMGRFLGEGMCQSDQYEHHSPGPGCRVLIGKGAQVHPTARFVGHVAVMDGGRIGADAVIVGPAVVGRNAWVEREAFVENSVLWDGAMIGEGCFVASCVVAEGASIAARTMVTDQAVLAVGATRQAK